MAATAQLNYIRIAPRKVRLVADLVRGKSARHAATILSTLPKGAAAPLLKLLRSAEANARHAAQGSTGDLYVKRIVVNEGPRLKRFRPRAFGRAAQILKRTSRISITLDAQ